MAVAWVQRAAREAGASGEKENQGNPADGLRCGKGRKGGHAFHNANESRLFQGEGAEKCRIGLLKKWAVPEDANPQS